VILTLCMRMAKCDTRFSVEFARHVSGKALIGVDAYQSTWLGTFLSILRFFLRGEDS
jgi:hypothetical protein